MHNHTDNSETIDQYKSGDLMQQPLNSETKAVLVIPLHYLIQNQFLLLITGGLAGILSYSLSSYLLKIRKFDEVKLVFVGIVGKLKSRK